MAYQNDDGVPADTSKIKPNMVKDSGPIDTSHFTGTAPEPPPQTGREALSAMSDAAGATIDKGINAVKGYVAADQAAARSALGTGPQPTQPDAPMQTLPQTNFNAPPAGVPLSPNAVPSLNAGTDQAKTNLIGPLLPDNISPGVSAQTAAAEPSSSLIAPSQEKFDTQARLRASNIADRSNQPPAEPVVRTTPAAQHLIGISPPSPVAVSAPRQLGVESGLGWKTRLAKYKEDMDAFTNSQTNAAAMARENLAQAGQTQRTGMDQAGANQRTDMQNKNALLTTGMHTGSQEKIAQGQQTGENQRQDSKQTFEGQQAGNLAANNLKTGVIERGGSAAEAQGINSWNGNLDVSSMKTPVPSQAGGGKYHFTPVANKDGSHRLVTGNVDTGVINDPGEPVDPLAGTGKPGGSAQSAGASAQKAKAAPVDHKTVMNKMTSDKQKREYIDQLTPEEQQRAKRSL